MGLTVANRKGEKHIWWDKSVQKRLWNLPIYSYMRATTRNVESKPVQNRVPSSQNKMLNHKQCVYKMGSTTTLYHQIFVQNESHLYSSPIQFPLFSFSCSLLHLDWSALFRRPPLYFGSTLAACWWPLSKPPKIPRPKWKSSSCSLSILHMFFSACSVHAPS